MENIEQYAIGDGTYLSPVNGKIYKNKKAIISHLSQKSTEPRSFLHRLYNVECKHCKTEIICNSIKKHEQTCYLNPENLILCKVCDKPIKAYKKSKGTCSHACSNKFFRHIRNKPEKYKNYATLCFHYHKKECIVCGENNIVAVHHVNEDHNDNSIENLIPLCPTHHQYMHSRFKNLILDKVKDYIEKFKNTLSMV